MTLKIEIYSALKSFTIFILNEKQNNNKVLTKNVPDRKNVETK